MLIADNSHEFHNDLYLQRINQLELHVQILKDHLTSYGQASSSEAVNYIRNQIDFFEREMRIRKDYPNIKTSVE